MSLWQAAREGSADVCDKLLEAKVNPDLKDEVSAREMADQWLMRTLC